LEEIELSSSMEYLGKKKKKKKLGGWHSPWSPARKR
jgi:hypothetical protein